MAIVSECEVSETRHKEDETTHNSPCDWMVTDYPPEESPHVVWWRSSSSRRSTTANVHYNASS